MRRRSETFAAPRLEAIHVIPAIRVEHVRHQRRADKADLVLAHAFLELSDHLGRHVVTLPDVYLVGSAARQSEQPDNATTLPATMAQRIRRCMGWDFPISTDGAGDEHSQTGAKNIS